jgi:hypothetical protein
MPLVQPLHEHLDVCGGSERRGAYARRQLEYVEAGQRQPVSSDAKFACEGRQPNVNPLVDPEG